MLKDKQPSRWWVLVPITFVVWVLSALVAVSTFILSLLGMDGAGSVAGIASAVFCVSTYLFVALIVGFGFTGPLVTIKTRTITTYRDEE